MVVQDAHVEPEQRRAEAGQRGGAVAEDRHGGTAGAGTRRAFEHADPVPVGQQPGRQGEPTHAGAGDHHVQRWSASRACRPAPRRTASAAGRRCSWPRRSGWRSCTTPTWATPVAFTAGHHAELGLAVPPERISVLVTLYGGALFTLVSTPPEQLTEHAVRSVARAIVLGTLT